MRLEDMNSLDGERLSRAMMEAGVTMQQGSEEFALRADSPAYKAFLTLAGALLAPMDLSDDEWDRMMALAAVAFCIGVTYATIPSGKAM